MNNLQRLFKNTVAMSITSALRLGVGLVLTIYIARALGPAFLGKYTLLVAYINIFQILAEAGIPRLITREVARSPQAAGRYFWNALVMQLACSLLASLAMVGIVELLNYPADTKLMLYLATGSLPAYAIMAAAGAILQAYERMELTTLAEMVSSIGQLVATIVVLSAGYGVVGLALVKVLGFVLVALVNLLALRWLRPTPGAGRGLVNRPEFDLRFGWHLVLHARTILLMALFGAVLLRLDVLIITQIWGEAVTGVYNAAYQLVKAFVLLIWAYVDAIYPVLSRLHQEGPRRLRNALAGSLQYGSLAILPLAVGATLLAEPVIRLVYHADSFLGAATALRLLVWHLLPYFVHTVLIRALIASDRQATASRIEGMVLVAAVAYEVVLVYFFGMIGAAIAANLIFLTGVLLSWRAVTGITGSLDVPWAQIGKTVLATLGMGGTVWLLRGSPLWVSVPAGAVAFVALALAVGAMQLRELRAFVR